ncbi:peroxiredoxin [uncultured Cellulomonas sp.]|uniref:peroxiredoxin n=1 Tax=uncultured Cellulomonas sp. TaxID=189682 RepID=UPI0028E5F10E|nr:peroxiredoxin [uncultured Cellulomonas sp.]
MEAIARPTPALGSPAPEFSLPDTHGTPVTPAGLRGGPVVIVFVPFAFSATCTGELCQLRDNIAEFEDAGAHVVVISCDPGHALRAWAAQEGFGFDLLSDFWPHGEVAKAYGVFDDAKGFAVRGSFLLDAEGVLRWSVVNPPGRARDFGAYREALAALTA